MRILNEQLVIHIAYNISTRGRCMSGHQLDPVSLKDIKINICALHTILLTLMTNYGALAIRKTIPIKYAISLWGFLRLLPTARCAVAVSLSLSVTRLPLSQYWLTECHLFGSIVCYVSLCLLLFWRVFRNDMHIVAYYSICLPRLALHSRCQ